MISTCWQQRCSRSASLETLCRSALCSPVCAGDLIGTLYDLLGQTLFECRAVAEGIVIVQLHLRHVTAGYFLAVVI